MKEDLPAPLAELALLLKNLPGVGRRGSERLALALLNWDSAKLEELGEAIASLPEAVGFCPVCGGLVDKSEPSCFWCEKPGRDDRLLCLVEDASQILNIEKSNSYRGRYFVLGGKLSPLDGKSADDLRLDELESYLANRPVEEVIIAFGSDVEGRATAIFVADFLSGKSCRVSQIAAGIPAGANLNYADSATIAVALTGRKSLK